MPISLYSSPMKYKDPTTGEYREIQGISGRGIRNIELNNDYTLTITFTDDTSVTTTSIRGAQGPVGPEGPGVIEGGTTGQFLIKKSNTDYDTEWGSETDPTVPSWAKAAEKPSYTAQEVGALPDNTFIPTKVSDLTDDSGHYTKPASGIPASDIAAGVIPDITVKADKVSSAVNGNFAALDSSGNLTDSSHKHSDYMLASLKGANNGVAELDANGKVPSAQLPSYVDDVLEYDNLAAFPVTGETGKIYVAKDTNLTYRWSGSAYVEISQSLALGETSSTAYRGDYGAAAYAHGVTNKGSAFSSGLYKITTNSEGHVTAASAVEKSDITALGIPAQDTTYTSQSAESGGTAVSLVTTGEKYNWNNKYNKPAGGIPLSDLAEEVLNENETEVLIGEAIKGFVRYPVIDVKWNGSTIVSDGIANLSLESKAAVSNGIAVSLVTTGEKYTWNNKYSKPSTGIPATDIASGVIPDISNKADKVDSATSGNFASLDSNGNLVDSGHKHSDYLTSHQTIPVTDVQINSSSIISNGVADIPIAGFNLGVVRVADSTGISAPSPLGILSLVDNTDALIKGGTSIYALNPKRQHTAVFYGLAKAAGDTTQAASDNAVGNYTETAKSKIADMLGASESVSGTTPSITAKSGIRYVCGECSTLAITTPASGIIDVVFKSGTTPTVLTVTPPSGQMMMWPAWFDPTSLDANTTYELNILDGVYGAVTSWT